MIRQASFHQRNTHDFRILELDGVRGLAIALVLCRHFIHDPLVSMPNRGRLGDLMNMTMSLGATGVDLFFVLSGFLIGGILLDRRTAEHFFKPFYVRRACRILPLYYSIIVAYAVARWLLTAHSMDSWYQWLFVSGVPLWSHLIFMQTILQVALHGTAWVVAGWLTVTWSLTVEEQFYLILPLMVRLVRPDWLPKICIAGVLVHPLFHFFLWLYHPVVFWNAIEVFNVQADALFWGGICAWLIRQDWFHEWLQASRNALYALLGMFVCATAFTAPIFDSYGVAQDLFIHPCFAILYALLLLLAITYRDGILARTMRFGPLRRLGIVSYGVYLLHMPINGLLHGLILGEAPSLRNFADVLITLLALVMTLTLAALSWRFFEKPIITWGHSVRYENDKPLVSTDVSASKAEGSVT